VAAETRLAGTATPKGVTPPTGMAMPVETRLPSTSQSTDHGNYSPLPTSMNAHGITQESPPLSMVVVVVREPGQIPIASHWARTVQGIETHKNKPDPSWFTYVEIRIGRQAPRRQTQGIVGDGGLDWAAPTATRRQDDLLRSAPGSDRR
jgi:hypothetical protein